MLDHLNNKKIILGITGGIAAYKSCELIRLLKTNHADVKVIVTPAGLEFITPLTLKTLSNNPVYTDLFDQSSNDWQIDHIELARWADMILIAPATANTLAKLAYGIADNLLTTICLASDAPIAVAPAMNHAMWENHTTQENLKALEKKGIKIFGPEMGFQACGEIGPGRMIPPAEIVSHLHHAFSPPLLENKKVVITAGPTIEPIDPVRCMTNYSSGKMGYAIAKAARDLGATVTLITGPTCLPLPHHVTATHIKTAEEMRQAVMLTIHDCDIFIATAAVADYRPEIFSTQKMKRSEETISLKFIKNPDILGAVAALPNPPFTVGFAAETEHVLEHARQKLSHKNIDLIAANEVGDNKGFNSDENALIIITRAGETITLPKKSKSLLAYELLEIINKCL